jgi:GTP-binding protein
LLQQERWRRRVATAKLNAWLRALVQYHAPPAAGGRTVKVKYITQVGQRPPKFAVFCNRSEELADHYRSFMLNSLRNEFDLQGVPLRLVVRSSDNPYSKQE